MRRRVVVLKAWFLLRHKHKDKHNGSEDAQQHKHNHERMSRMNDSLYLLDAVKQYGRLIDILLRIIVKIVNELCKEFKFS